ncbi:MAG TPA: class I SAM-dependent methyltransferase [Dermatophilaceae bacterium]|nr:class I SAM-dependent methyltransferase [Dermatophilaceae bacterium]
MDVTAVRALASVEGQTLLRSLPPHDEAAALALTARLRALGHDPALVAAALTQQRLRARARAKFGEFADGMIFTAEGLEQATRLEVATTHAHRFGAASLATVHDLGCGIGADAMTMSVLGVTVRAVDADPVTAAVADVNLRPWPDSRARVGRAEDFRPPPDAQRDRVGAWLDPARRLPGRADARGRARRVFRLHEMSPPWQVVLDVAAAVPATGAKLSPSLPHEAVPVGCEAQWTSWDGDVVECAVWWGPLVRTAGRTARVLGPGRLPVEVTAASVDPDVPAATSLADVGAWLYETDRAVVRAGLVGAVTAATDGTELEAGLGHVVAGRAVDLAFARRYAVTEAMPFTVKSLRAWLRERGVTGATIKKRGVRLDDDSLRRDLRLGRGSGEGNQVTLLLTRLAGDTVVLVLEAG